MSGTVFFSYFWECDQLWDEEGGADETSPRWAPAPLSSPFWQLGYSQAKQTSWEVPIATAARTAPCPEPQRTAAEPSGQASFGAELL